MTAFRCAIEDAKRPGRERCKTECQSCRQQFLKRDDGRPMTTVETAGGSYFDYACPLPEQITLDDVAHHLAITCRFGGASVDTHGSPVLYSVAEHAIFVRATVIEWGYPHLALPALHHDSHEYMLGDWPTPLKRQLRAAGVTVLDDLVEATNIAIGEKFGIDPVLFDNVTVKEADALALYREAATFKTSRGVGAHWGRTIAADPLEWEQRDPSFIKQAFIAAHRQSGGQ